MRIDEAVASYFETYNEKQTIITNPLNKDGVVAAEQGKLTGIISFDQLRAFCDTQEKVEQEFRDKIATLDARLAELAPTIVTYLTGKDSRIAGIAYRDTGQTLRVQEGAIVIAPTGSQN